MLERFSNDEIIRREIVHLGDEEVGGKDGGGSGVRAGGGLENVVRRDAGFVSRSPELCVARMFFIVQVCLRPLA